jgi:hypothetical protein
MRRASFKSYPDTAAGPGASVAKLCLIVNGGSVNSDWLPERHQEYIHYNVLLRWFMGTAIQEIPEHLVFATHVFPDSYGPLKVLEVLQIVGKGEVVYNQSLKTRYWGKSRCVFLGACLRLS